MNKNTKFKDAVNCIAGILGPLKKKLKKSGSFVSCLTELCQKVADFRQPMKITCRLSGILCMCLLIAMQASSPPSMEPPPSSKPMPIASQSSGSLMANTSRPMTLCGASS